MRLWLFIPKEVYENTIIRTGVYTCDSSKCEMLLDDTDDHQLERAYNWLDSLYGKK